MFEKLLNLPGIACPMHGVDLGQMTFERTPNTQMQFVERLDVVGHLFDGRITCLFPSFLWLDEGIKERGDTIM